MDREHLIEQIDEILALLARQPDGGKGGLSEQRRQLLVRLVTKLRDEISQMDR